MKKLMILVSGGRASARMALHIHTDLKYSDYEKLYVFCNTGQERQETIDFLKDIVKYWGIPLNIIEGVYSLEPGIGVKSKLVDFDTMDMRGRVFSEMIEHLNKNKWTGVPNSAIPYCSEYLKTRPSHHFAKEIFGTTKYIKALGYRKEDMPKRITLAELNEDSSIIAPNLTDFEVPIGQLDLNVFFEFQPFKLMLHSKFSNCELCWKKSIKNLIEAIQYGTRFIDWHRDEEAKYGNYFFRENMSIDDLVRLAESGTQLSLLDNIGDKCVCNFK
ncbi:phosphoadenosine phosphosulfate reductase [Flavobacterium covae]|nr:phosphoadenosine phosphosulfate reductase [Flavobacterium covae]